MGRSERGAKIHLHDFAILAILNKCSAPLQRSKNGWGDKTSLLIYSVQQLRSCFGSFWLWSSSSSSSSRSWRKERSSAVAGTAYPWAPPTEQHLPTCRHILKCCRCDATNWALLPFGKSARRKKISALWLTGGLHCQQIYFWIRWKETLFWILKMQQILVPNTMRRNIFLSLSL